MIKLLPEERVLRCENSSGVRTRSFAPCLLAIKVIGKATGVSAPLLSSGYGCELIHHLTHGPRHATWAPVRRCGTQHSRRGHILVASSVITYPGGCVGACGKINWFATSSFFLIFPAFTLFMGGKENLRAKGSQGDRVMVVHVGRLWGHNHLGGVCWKGCSEWSFL